MIRTFARIPGWNLVLSAAFAAILAGIGSAHAQQTQAQPAPAQQPPADQTQTQQQPETQQSSSSQEASPEETARERRAKVKNYKSWVFNVGGGASLTNGTTNKFVRSGGGVAAAGVAHNYDKYLGLRLDFQWDNLPLRASALQSAQAPGATDHVYSLTFDPIINVSITKTWGGYVLFGPGFYHRSGKLDSSTAIPGSSCNPFFTWWGHCYNASLPINGHFLNASENEIGYNFGGGLTRKITYKIDFYAEFRYLHGSHSGKTTDLRPITVGIRW